MYVVKGGGVVRVKDREIKLKSGDFILIDSDVPHRLKVAAEKPCRMLNIEFVLVPCEDTFYSVKNLLKNVPHLREFFESKESFLVLKDPNETLSELIKGLIRQLNMQEPTNLFMQQLVLSQILISISKLQYDSTLHTIEDTNKYVADAIDYMLSHYDYDLKVGSIAKAVNIHERYLQQLFKEQLDITVNDYLTNLRIEKAEQLLIYTDLSIVKISQYVGMNTQQYFSYLFKKKTGFSPRAYRKQMIRLEIEE